MTDITLRLVSAAQVAGLTIKSYYQGETSHATGSLACAAARPAGTDRRLHSPATASTAGTAPNSFTSSRDMIRREEAGKPSL